jgi:uracil-DNA glycosylase
MESGAYEIMTTDGVERFVQLLQNSPDGAVFNPWWEVDEQNDRNRNAPAVRRKQLAAYLDQRLGKAKLILIGEALGYRGGHFSGIPMTSERILLGKKRECGITPEHVFSSIKACQTSTPKECPNGFSEPTATIVWSSLLGLGLKHQQFVLWNAFPWHSFVPRRGMLSNRMPTQKERSYGLPVLQAFLDLFSCDEIVALGNVAASQLEKLKVESHRVRHPASGGAKRFRQQIEKIVALLK